MSEDESNALFNPRGGELEFGDRDHGCGMCVAFLGRGPFDIQVGSDVSGTNFNSLASKFLGWKRGDDGFSCGCASEMSKSYSQISWPGRPTCQAERDAVACSICREPG